MKKVGAVGVAGAAFLLGMTALPGVMGAQEANSPQQEATFQTGSFAIDLRPGDSRSFYGSEVPLTGGDSAVTRFTLVNRSDAPIGALEITPRMEGTLFKNPSYARVDLRGCDKPYDASGKCGGREIPLVKEQTSGKQTIKQTIPARGMYYMKITTTLDHEIPDSLQGEKGSIGYVVKATQALQADALPQPESR